MIDETPTKKSSQKRDDENYSNMWMTRIAESRKKKVSGVFNFNIDLQPDPNKRFCSMPEYIFELATTLVQEVSNHHEELKKKPGYFDRYSDEKLDAYISNQSAQKKKEIEEAITSILTERDQLKFMERKRRAREKYGLHTSDEPTMTAQNDIIPEGNRNLIQNEFVRDLELPKTKQQITQENLVRVLNMRIIQRSKVKDICFEVGVTRYFVYKAISLLRQRRLLHFLNDTEIYANKRNQKYSENTKTFFFQVLEIFQGQTTLKELRNIYRMAYPRQLVPSLMTISNMLREMDISRKKVYHVPGERNSEVNKKRRYK